MRRKLTMALNAHKNITAIGRTQEHAFIQWMLKAVRAFPQKIGAEEIYNIDVMKITFVSENCNLSVGYQCMGEK